MKVLFTASLRGKKYFEQQYKTIFKEIEKLGYDHISSDIINENKMIQGIREGTREANIAMYKKKIDDLKKADICVFEYSFHSLSIGFVIQKSLELNKPTIVLYYKNNDPEILSGIEDEKLILRKYDDKTLNSVLEDSFKQAREARDTRFNFFIGPSLLTYLEEASQKDGVTKSTFIRNLIIGYKRKLQKAP